MTTTKMPQDQDNNNNNNSSSSSCPTAYTDNDVLCGRGGVTNTHEGNVRFRTLVSDRQGEYLVAGKKEKGLMARAIVETIQDRGGRFIAKNATTDVWETVPEKKAIEKASQALREGLNVRHRVANANVRVGAPNAIAERKTCMTGATEKTLLHEAPKANETSKAHPKTTAKKETEKITTEKKKTPEAEPIEKQVIAETTTTDSKQQAVLFGVLCDGQDKRARSGSESSVDETHPDKVPKVTAWTDYENRLKSL
jgi:hypothetical protein